MRHWWRSYWLLLRWSVLQQRAQLPFLLMVQTLLGMGVVVGFAFLVPAMDRPTALYLATGAPTIALIIVGFVAVPQTVAHQKLTGTFDYLRSMPVPRLALLAADATVWVVLALPGLVASLGVAAWRFRPVVGGQPACGAGGVADDGDVCGGRLWAGLCRQARGDQHRVAGADHCGDDVRAGELPGGAVAAVAGGGA